MPRGIGVGRGRPLKYPDYSIGFGPIHGVGTTDAVLSAVTTSGTLRTYSCWVRLIRYGPSNLPRIFDKRTTAVGEIETMYVDTAAGSYTVNYNRARAVTTGSWRFFPDERFGEWNHICLTYDGGDVANDPVAYVDGVILPLTDVATPAGALSTNAEAYCIGNRGSDRARAFDGNIGQFAIWDAILTPGEVALLAQGASPLEIRETELVEFIDPPPVRSLKAAAPTIVGTRVHVHNQGRPFVMVVPTPNGAVRMYLRDVTRTLARIPSMCRLTLAGGDHIATNADALTAIGASNAHGISFWLMFDKQLDATTARRILDFATGYSAGNNVWGVSLEQESSSASLARINVYQIHSGGATQHRPRFVFYPGILYKVAINYDHSSATNVPRFFIDGTEYPAVQISSAAGTIRTLGDTLIIGATISGASQLYDASLAHVTANAAEYSEGTALALSRGASPWSITDAAGPNGHPDFYAALQTNAVEEMQGFTLNLHGSPTFWTPGLAEPLSPAWMGPETQPGNVPPPPQLWAQTWA